MILRSVDENRALVGRLRNDLRRSALALTNDEIKRLGVTESEISNALKRGVLRVVDKPVETVAPAELSVMPKEEEATRVEAEAVAASVAPEEEFIPRRNTIYLRSQDTDVGGTYEDSVSDEITYPFIIHHVQIFAIILDVREGGVRLVVSDNPDPVTTTNVKFGTSIIDTFLYRDDVEETGFMYKYQVTPGDGSVVIDCYPEKEIREYPRTFHLQYNSGSAVATPDTIAFAVIDIEELPKETLRRAALSLRSLRSRSSIREGERLPRSVVNRAVRPGSISRGSNPISARVRTAYRLAAIRGEPPDPPSSAVWAMGGKPECEKPKGEWLKTEFPGDRMWAIVWMTPREWIHLRTPFRFKEYLEYMAKTYGCQPRDYIHPKERVKLGY